MPLDDVADTPRHVHQREQRCRRVELADRLEDFLAAPQFGVLFGSVYVIGGLLIVLCTAFLHTGYLVYPLAAGFAMRSERIPLWRLGLLTNAMLVAAVAGTVMLQIALVSVPALRDVFSLEPLEGWHWLVAVGVALAYYAFVELEKAWSRSRGRAAG